MIQKVAFNAGMVAFDSLDDLRTGGGTPGCYAAPCWGAERSLFSKWVTLAQSANLK